MTFSMKPQTGSVSGSTATNEQWVEWNTYMYNLIDAEERAVQGRKGVFHRSKSLVGILNCIVDVGFQPQPDAKYDTKCALPKEDEEYSEEELKHLQKYPTNNFIWVDDEGVKKRKQTAPVQPEQEYAFLFDFPEVLVDWSNHPIEDLRALGVKPLRVSYNGVFKKDGVVSFSNRLPFRLDFRNGNTLSDKNPISKIATKMGVNKQFIAAKYDLGVLAGEACKWTVIAERRVVDDKSYFEFKIKEPASIDEVKAGSITVTREQQIPACDVPFMGVLFNADSYDEGVIEYIKKRGEIVEVLKRAVSFKPSPEKFPDFVLGIDFKDSGICKALGLAEDAGVSEPEGGCQVEATSASVEKTEAAIPPASPDRFDTLEDDIPF